MIPVFTNFFHQYFLWFFQILKTEGKKAFWTNKKFVFFFNWEIVVKTGFVWFDLMSSSVYNILILLSDSACLIYHQKTVSQANIWFIKFIYSEKATRISKKSSNFILVSFSTFLWPSRKKECIRRILWYDQFSMTFSFLRHGF